MLIEFFKCIFTECVFAIYFVTCLSIQFNFIELLLSTTRIFSHCCRIYLFLINNGFSNSEGLPDNSEVKKKSTWNAGEAGASLISGLGRYPAGRTGYPLQYSYLENPMNRRTWGATIHSISQSQT